MRALSLVAVTHSLTEGSFVGISTSPRKYLFRFRQASNELMAQLMPIISYSRTSYYSLYRSWASSCSLSFSIELFLVNSSGANLLLDTAYINIYIFPFT